MNYEELVKLAYEDIMDGFDKEAGFATMMTKLPKFSSKVGDSINAAAKSGNFRTLSNGALNYGKAMDSITHGGSYMPTNKSIRYNAGKARAELHTAGKNLNKMYAAADKMGIGHSAHPRAGELNRAYDMAKAKAGAWRDLKTSSGLTGKLFPNSQTVTRARNNIGSVFSNPETIGNIQYF